MAGVVLEINKTTEVSKYCFSSMIKVFITTQLQNILVAILAILIQKVPGSNKGSYLPAIEHNSDTGHT